MEPPALQFNLYIVYLVVATAPGIAAFVGAESDGGSVDEVVIGHVPDGLFCVEKVAHDAIYGDRVGGKEKTVGRIVGESRPGGGFTVVVQPVGVRFWISSGTSRYFASW